MTVSWGERWRSVLGGPDHELARRVRQGRATYRSGRVSDVRLAAGRVSARVQGSRATPFLVEVEIPLLSDEDWDIVIDLLAGKVRYRARLLAGHEPEGLAEEAEAAGVRLFPTIDETRYANPQRVSFGMRGTRVPPRASFSWIEIQPSTCWR